MMPLAVDHHHVAGRQCPLAAVHEDVPIVLARHIHPHRKRDGSEVMTCRQDQVRQLHHEHRLDQSRPARDRLALDGNGFPLRLHVIRLAMGPVVVDVRAHPRLGADAVASQLGRACAQTLLELTLVDLQRGALLGVVDPGHDEDARHRAREGGLPCVRRRQYIALLHRQSEPMAEGALPAGPLTRWRTGPPQPRVLAAIGGRSTANGSVTSSALDRNR